MSEPRRVNAPIGGRGLRSRAGGRVVSEDFLVAAVGRLPGEARVVRAGRYAELLKVFGLRDPVPTEFLIPFATAWRALAEGVERIYLAPNAEALALLPEPLVVAGAPAPASAPQAGPRLYLYDPPRAIGGEALALIPEGMVGLWPWIQGVLPGVPSAVALPPSVLAAGLYARGAAFSTWAADPLPGAAPPAGWVRLVPVGKRRLLHLDPAPPRPGTPFPVEDVTETELELLWAEARASSHPVEALTRALQSRYGAGVRVFLEDAGIRVLLPPPAPRSGGLILRMGRR